MNNLRHLEIDNLGLNLNQVHELCSKFKQLEPLKTFTLKCLHVLYDHDSDLPHTERIILIKALFSCPLQNMHLSCIPLTGIISKVSQDPDVTFHHLERLDITYASC